MPAFLSTRRFYVNQEEMFTRTEKTAVIVFGYMAGHRDAAVICICRKYLGLVKVGGSKDDPNLWSKLR